MAGLATEAWLYLQAELNDRASRVRARNGADRQMRTKPMRCARRALWR